MDQKTNTILGMILGVILLGGGYFFLKNKNQTPEETPTATTTPEEMTSTSGVEPSYTIVEIKDEAEKLPPPPDFEKPLVFTVELFPENKQKMIDQWKLTVDELKKDHNSLDKWLQLGLLRKAAGDYDGAREAWEYAGVIRPKNSISFANMGVLYGYYLKDPQKAEQNFLKAIGNDKVLTYYYAQTADFYLEVLKSKEKAINILTQGIKEVSEPEGRLLKEKINEIEK